MIMFCKYSWLNIYGMELHIDHISELTEVFYDIQSA